MTSRAALVLVIALALVPAACDKSGFDDGTAQSALQASPINLVDEQVNLTMAQVDCGAKEDLWDAVTQYSPERSIAHLTAKGRDLKFNDDITVTEPGSTRPWVQVAGTFSLSVMGSAGAIKDGDNGTKIVEIKAGVVIPHSCFPQPLPLMGVRHGKFTTDAAPSFRFKPDPNGWLYDKILH